MWWCDVTYDAGDSLVVALVQRVALHVGAFLVVVDTAELIRHARRDSGDALQWTVSIDSVLDVFPWCRPQRFLIRVLHGCHRAVLLVSVTGEAGGIVRSLVVVLRYSGSVESIDNVGALEVLLPKMVSTVRSLGLFANRV